MVEAGTEGREERRGGALGLGHPSSSCHAQRSGPGPVPERVAGGGQGGGAEARRGAEDIGQRPVMEPERHRLWRWCDQPRNEVVENGFLLLRSVGRKVISFPHLFGPSSPVLHHSFICCCFSSCGD